MTRQRAKIDLTSDDLEEIKTALNRYIITLAALRRGKPKKDRPAITEKIGRAEKVLIKFGGAPA